MIEELVDKKIKGHSLDLVDYYYIVDYVLKHGATTEFKKMMFALNTFGMNKKEVYYFSLAIRDSGKVLHFDGTIFEKHSTGGIGDPTSIVLIPLIASLGNKIIKTSGRSFAFTNGSSDRFGAIPNFKTKLSDKDIKKCLDETNACVLSHTGDMCPVDRILFDLREEYELENDINFIATSIASKKLSSGANVVLVDIKYGYSSIVKNYNSAKKLARILKYVFKRCKVKSVIVLTNTKQTIGSGIGNAVEVVDAIETLKGKKGLLRDVSVEYAKLLIREATPTLNKKDLNDMIESNIDNGQAYERFLQIIKAQGGDEKFVKDNKFFAPKKTMNFVCEREGYVGNINSLLLGELIHRLCINSHDNNIGAVLKVKIGDYVKVGDVVLTLYYTEENEIERYVNAIRGCVRVTKEKIKPIKVIKRIIK